MTVTLYLAVDCPDLPAAQSMFQHFIDAGLKDDDPRVHHAYGETMTKEGEAVVTTNQENRRQP